MRLAGLRIITLESRRADLVQGLIAEQGGECFNAPSVRERPYEENPPAIQFAKDIIAGRYDMVIFTTGVGTQYLLDLLAAGGRVEPFLQALRKVQVVARGPKPVAALSQAGLRVTVSVPESYTWREVLDATAAMKCSSVAVQEYGVPNPELIDGLRQRGSSVTPVAIYRWDLPEDVTPLEDAVRRICDRWCNTVIFLSSVQFTNLLRIAERAEKRDAMLLALQQDIVVVSIGPVMTDTLIREGIQPDFEPKHPKLAYCIKQFSEHASELISAKRARKIE
ncbi:MAG TPA: uroporphyrinogen-III synthase [Terriglobia bacterium]|nr:uroporphyrinogen-III synthase [Terriglobia bacterium]